MFQWWEKHEYVFYCLFCCSPNHMHYWIIKLKSIPTVSKYVPMVYQFKFDSEYVNV